MSINLPNSDNYKVVDSFEELIDTVFYGNTNAICFQRDLKGDFEEIVHKLQLKEDITEIQPEDLYALELTADGQIARQIIVEDYNRLKEYGAQPNLNLLKCYEKDEEFDFISTDVYSYHVDRSPTGMPTFLCTYFGAASDILPNHQAVQQVQIPAIRNKLFSLFEGSETEFEIFLQENYFDLHYEAADDAIPLNLGVGNLWKLAVDHPDQTVLPCVHRAPIENKNEYRLMLIC